MRVPPTFLGCAFLLIIAGQLLSATIHVSPTGSDVTGDGSLLNPYQTISMAATFAVSGDVIMLSPGIFGDAEQIVLGTKDLTLVGAGIGATVIRPHLTLDLPLSVGAPPGSPVNHRIVIAVTGSARVDIRDLTIDGDFRMPATGRLGGLYYSHGADGTISNVEIKNMRADPLNGAQGPGAVVVRGYDAIDPCLVTLRNCHIHDWGKVGIVSFYNTHLIVEYCTIEASGPVPLGGPAQNCIQVGTASSATIRNNAVTDSRYIPTTWAASGILLYNAGPGTVIDNNSVARCEEGIFMVQSPSAFAPAEVRRNRVTAAIGRAIRVDGQTGVNVDGNVAHAAHLLGAAVLDNTSGGNTWSHNNYSNWSGAGAYALPGSTYVDLDPRRGCDELQPGTAISLGAAPVDLVVAQLDGSDQRDFATVNLGTPPSLSIGLASGGSWAVSSVPFGSINGRPVALVRGEFDGLPGIDLAVATVNVPPATSENKVYVFANDGGGGFSLLHIQLLPTSAGDPSDLAAADFNGGVDDLVVSYEEDLSGPGGGLIMLNSGSGTGFIPFFLPGTLTLSALSVATGMVDGGSTVDVVLTEGDGSTGFVHVFGGDGAGGFTPLAGSPFSVDPDPVAVTVADVDGDDLQDILVACTNGTLPVQRGSAVILRNLLAGGFETRTYPTDLGPVSIAAGDIGNDADPDTVRTEAVVVNFAAADLTLLGERGHSGFVSGGLCFAGASPRAAVIADMDGDPFHDIVVADSSGLAVKLLSGVSTNRDDLFGSGCAGYRGRVPMISASGQPAVPNLGNLTFGIEVRNARPFSLAVMVLSVSPGPTIGSCAFLLDDLDFVFTSMTNVDGRAGLPFEIPAAPVLLGAQGYFQWGVLDPDGQFGFFSLTEGLRIRIGE